MRSLFSVTFVSTFLSSLLWIAFTHTDSLSAKRPIYSSRNATLQKRVVFIAGGCSHGRGEHEHKAGCLLLAKRLNDYSPSVQAQVYSDGWPQDSAAFENVASVVLYGDGGEGHMVNQHLEQVAALMKKGVGLVCIHYAVEVPKGKPGNYFLDWLGGFFETYWSVNPVWTAQFEAFPNHPITRGVTPFTMLDEWYYHMRFRPSMEQVTPILTAIPPASSLNRPDGPHENNADVKAEAGKPQHVA